MIANPQLRQQVREVIASSLLVDEDELPPDASQDTCDRWTSLYHLTLLLNLEDRFGVSFSVEQMTRMTSESEIVQALEERLSS